MMQIFKLPIITQIIIFWIFTGGVVSSSSVLADLIPNSPTLSAKAYILMDTSSGNVLASKNMHKKLPPASLTKLMTAYIAEYQLNNGMLSLNDKVNVSKKAWKAKGSRMFIKVNDNVLLADILKGIIIQSGNDASIALAEHIADNEAEFATLMNKFAQKIGMQNTSFKNSTGLPAAEHYTTAYDLAILATHVISDFPEHYAQYAQKSFTYNNIKQFNRNKLLWLDPSVDGLKTGHTSEAGYNIVVSAKRDKTRLIVVILGADSEQDRISDSKRLLKYGFRYFETYKAFDKANYRHNINIFGGVKDKIALKAATEPNITIMLGQKDNVKMRVIVDKFIHAPIIEGQSYAKLELYIKDKILASVDLIAPETVEEANIIVRFWDYLAALFYKIFDINPHDRVVTQNEYITVTQTEV